MTTRGARVSKLISVVGAVALAVCTGATGCAAGGEGGGFHGTDDAGPGGDGSVTTGRDGGTTGRDGSTTTGRDGGTTTGDGGTVPDPDAGTGLLGPPYPIVLAHGFFGFDSLLGIVDYWYQIPSTLEAAGETQVYVTAVDPFNGSAYRGAQLEMQIEDILAETGYAKVNIIGHSQGGLDARVVAHDRPDLVASVTTIATPHRGSQVADLVDSLSGPALDALLQGLAQLLGLFYSQDVSNSDVLAALQDFSQPGIMAFNATYTDSPGVQYFSITGRSDRTRASDCPVTDPPAFITMWDDQRDPIDPLLSLTENYLDNGQFNLLTNPNTYPNDGLVRVESGMWGRFLGCVPADHLDEVGQLFGDSPGIGNDFDYLELYLDLVAWLRDQGF